MKDVFLWYSGATDITGTNLADALGIEHGKSQPKGKKIVIGWGTKTNENVSLGTAKVLNHPDKIRDNRNKLSALGLLQAAKVNVAKFTEDSSKIGKKGGIALPVIGRTRHHQGGKGFWSCPTMSQVREALDSGAQYFQEMIDIKDEYRLHTFGDKVIYAVKKVKRTTEEMEVAYVKHELERQKSLTEKSGAAFDEAMATSILQRQAKKFAQDGANALIRSNRLGWKFIHMKVVPKELVAQAVAALKALALDFGAVDACTDADGKHWILEVNTGPGLEETPFKAYVDALKGEIEKLAGKAPVVSSKTVEAAAKVAAKVATVEGGSLISLRQKAALMKEMTERLETDEEAAVFDKVMQRMFGA